MLRGELATTPLDEVLRLLAEDRATGRLALKESADGAPARTAGIYVAAGEVYAAWLAGPDADPVIDADERLRRRLLAGGTLREEAWDDAVAAQEELFDWSIGELLVELGHLERATLERVATEELLDAVSHAYGWRFGSYRFHRRERTRNRAGRTYDVSDLLEAVAARRTERERLEMSAGAVPMPGNVPAEEVEGLEAAVLGLVDGARPIEEIEAACGCTELEVAQLLRSMTDRGYVLLPEPASPPVAPEESDSEDDDPLSRWSALLDSALPPHAHEVEPPATVELVRSDLPPRPVENLDPETAQRRARLRARAAEELLAAQAEAEALREAQVARAALADELSVAAEIRVFEDAIGIRPVDQAEPTDAPEVVKPVDLVEAVESVALETAEPAAAEAESVASMEAVDISEAEAAVPVEPVDAVEPVEALDADAGEGAVSDASSEASVDLLAEELPLAAPVAETPTARLPEHFEVAEQVEMAEQVEVAEQVEKAEPEAPEVAVEAADEHDPALAAALLRELSSLGLDEEPVPATTRTARVPAPRHAATPGRKKRGIFGR